MYKGKVCKFYDTTVSNKMLSIKTTNDNIKYMVFIIQKNGQQMIKKSHNFKITHVREANYNNLA
jgi:hypothetical protein